MSNSKIDFMLEHGIPNSDPIKALFPVGAGLDVPSGTYLKGMDGAWYLNGGLGVTTGIVGGPNSQKTGIADFLALSMADRMCQTHTTKIQTYDTEVNVHLSRKRSLAMQFESFKNGDVISSGKWEVTDKSKLWGDEYFEHWKEYAEKKRKNASVFNIETPFMVDDGTQHVMLTPTITIVDSVTEFEHSAAAKIQQSEKLGSKDALTVYMQLGLAKARMFSAMTTICESTASYSIFTAHVGDEPPAIGRPSHLPPPKKIHTIAPGDKVKGVSDKFFFLMSNSYQIVKVEWLYNSSKDRTPKYPSREGSSQVDLMLVTMAVLRSKSGPSGVRLPLVISQKEGVSPALTDFYALKEAGDYGIEGNAQNYVCSLLPDVKLCRTNIRTKIADIPALSRALCICHEMMDIATYKIYTDPEQVCTPKQLYDDLTKLGYDWNKILTETRGWHTVNNDNHPLPTISTLTLMDMRLSRLSYPKLMVDKKK